MMKNVEMPLHLRIISARKKKGLTQDELADLARVTVRTIQRIESGETVPRPFTVKSIAVALDLTFDSLNRATNAQEIKLPGSRDTKDDDDTVHFLKTLCLSCFTYLIVPYIHFLIPAYLLKKRNEKNQQAISFARKLIHKQVSWVIATIGSLLLILFYNFAQAAYLNKKYPVNYLWPFIIMYLINAFLILSDLQKIKKIGQHPVTTA
jgi:XRE family transcriptional regulator, regulator of sulfur utilization